MANTAFKLLLKCKHYLAFSLYYKSNVLISILYLKANMNKINQAERFHCIKLHEIISLEILLVVTGDMYQ